jgi:hypothetical protein
MADINNKVYFPTAISDVSFPGAATDTTPQSGSQGGISADTVLDPNAINSGEFPYKKISDEVLSSSLDTQSKRILGSYSFGSMGAIKIGDYVSGSSGDLRLTPDGLTARNSSGETTFSIDGVTGNATFAGTLAAGVVVAVGALVVGSNVGIGTAQTAGQVTTIVGNTITTSYVNALNVTAKYVVASISISSPSISGGSIAIGSGNSIFKANSNGIYLGNSSFESAPFRVNMSGQVVAESITLTNASIGAGSVYQGTPIASAYIGNLTANQITTGTLTGLTVQSSSGGQRIVLDNGDLLRFYYGGSQTGYFWTTAAGLNINVSNVYFNGSTAFNGVATCLSDFNLNGQRLYLGNSSGSYLARTGNNNFNFNGGHIEVNANKIEGDCGNIDFSNGHISFNTSFTGSGNWVDIAGHLNVHSGLDVSGTKNFLIDHPDGSNRLLRYSAIESPEVLLKIRGVAQLNNGLADIVLPRHFTLVTEKYGDVMVQLTALGDCNGVYARDVKNSGFSICEMRDGESDVEVAWEVTAIRKGYLMLPVELDRKTFLYEKKNIRLPEDKKVNIFLKESLEKKGLVNKASK